MPASRLFSFGFPNVEERLDALAIPLELKREQGEAPVLGGRYRGVPVRLDLEGDAARIRVRLDAHLPPGLWLRSRKHCLDDELEHPLHIGDAELDAALVAECDHPAAALRLLREPSLHPLLLTLFGQKNGTLDDGELTVRAHDTSVDGLRRVLSAAASFVLTVGKSARALEQARLEAIAETRRAPPPDLSGRKFVAGETSEARIMADFAGGRLKVFTQVVPLFALGAWLFSCAFRDFSLGPFDDGGSFAYLGFIVFASAVARFRTVFACPRCGTELHAREVLRRSPKRCTACDARLR